MSFQDNPRVIDFINHVSNFVVAIETQKCDGSTKTGNYCSCYCYNLSMTHTFTFGVLNDLLERLSRREKGESID